MLDSHCHLDRYDSAVNIAAEAEKAGVFVVAVTNLPSHFEIGQVHVKNLKRVRLALGLHPLAAGQHADERPLFVRLFEKTSFIGEVGLDFSREGKTSADVQVETFRLVAKQLSARPKFVTVHSRGAEIAVLDILREFDVSPVVFHWYSGPLGIIDEILSAGHYFSFNPAMVASKSGQKIIAKVPRDRTLTETDGPFVQYRGEPAKPMAVEAVERYLANIWHDSVDEARRTIWNNFRTIVTRLKIP
jgi:TatD DNase family protein